VLSELHISNFALIENLTLELHPGLNVLTGETGAGKSIIIEALNLVLGGHADKEDIRTGANNTRVEAIFNVSKNDSLSKILSNLSIEPENDLLILRRTIGLNRQSRNFVNDSPVTLKLLKMLGNKLVDIHGQHEHQNLLKIDKHIDYLDSFLGLKEKRETFATCFSNFLRKRKTLEELNKQKTQIKEKEELYRFQVKEIDETEITIDEDAELEKKQRILENSEKLIETIKNTYRTIYENENSVLDVVNRLKANIEPLCKIDGNLKKNIEQLDSVIFNIEEASSAFSAYLNKMEFNPAELDSITTRLDSINALKMKYGRTLAQILAYRDEKQKEVNEIRNIEIETETTEKELTELQQILARESVQISEQRAKRKGELEKRVNQELKELGMESSSFFVDTRRVENNEGIDFPNGKKYRVTEKGIDYVEFLITTNPGIPPMTLKKIISGGELSRIMLALKSILASLDDVHCMIFDEADSGIGGAQAEAVGDKMKQVSLERQVITLTHLHQIASKGDRHIKVEKEERNGTAYTYAKTLTKNQRVTEIARLISGEKLTETAIKHARKILTEKK